MEKQDLKIKQIPPFNEKAGVHVQKLAVTEMQELWHLVITLTNEQFKERCTNFCAGCKQLSNPNPCQLARVRYGMLQYAAANPIGRFHQAIIEDLKDAAFHYAPYYESPA